MTSIAGMKEHIILALSCQGREETSGDQDEGKPTWLSAVGGGMYYCLYRTNLLPFMRLKSYIILDNQVATCLHLT